MLDMEDTVLPTIKRRRIMIRNTDIKYLSVLDKIYRVTGIQWQQFTLEAEATNLSGGDDPPEEVSDIL